MYYLLSIIYYFLTLGLVGSLTEFRLKVFFEHTPCKWVLQSEQNDSNNPQNQTTHNKLTCAHISPKIHKLLNNSANA